MEAVAAVVPAPAETPTPAVTPAPEVVTPEVPKAPERTFTQAELDDILEKRLGKEKRKREDIERRLKVTEELALRRTEREREEPAKDAQPTGEPTREQFGSYEEYIEARADFRADQKVEKKFKEREEKDRELSAQEKQKQAGEAFRKSLMESAKDIEDFGEVLSGIKPEDPASNVSSHAIEACDAPGKVLYHLIKNPEEAERIASLPLGKQARELVELERKLTTAKKPSKAPEPISPVGGKATVADEMPDASKNPEAWMKWRNAQLQAKASAGKRK